MEVQLTDFENAAFSIFIVLLTRALLSFNLNFYLPISKVGVMAAPWQLKWTRACRGEQFHHSCRQLVWSDASAFYGWTVMVCR